MSSDYGSDILSDDIAQAEAAPTTAVTPCAPTATPRVPLTTRDANAPATPPPSHVKQGSRASGNPPASHSVASSTRRLLPLNPFCTPASPVPNDRTSHAVPQYQNAPSSSQPLPTSMTARMAPPTQYVTSSSQPTPSKRPGQTQPPIVAAHVLSGQHIPTTLGSRSDQANLYRFPFGAHRGKTLLEVPENYLAYLRVDQDMADSMPGFTAVLRQFDAGHPPALPAPPTPASQPVSQDVPSSSVPPQTPTSQSTSSQQQPPMPESPADYRFDFGIHAGKTLNECPKDYIDFLKQRGIVETKPALAVAVIKYEREQSRTAPASSISSSNSATFVLDFGKHKGKSLSEIPIDYITWLKSSNMYLESQPLRDAIAKYERLNPQARPKPAPKRKRAPQISQYSSRSLFAIRLSPPRKTKRYRRS